MPSPHKHKAHYRMHTLTGAVGVLSLCAAIMAINPNGAERVSLTAYVTPEESGLFSSPKTQSQPQRPPVVQSQSKPQSVHALENHKVCIDPETQQPYRVSRTADGRIIQVPIEDLLGREERQQQQQAANTRDIAGKVERELADWRQQLAASAAEPAAPHGSAPPEPQPELTFGQRLASELMRWFGL